MNAARTWSVFALPLLITSACRTGADQGSEALELDGRKFKYETISVEVIDSAGQPVENLAVMYSANRKEFRLIGGDFIPLPDPRWVSASYSAGIVGFTDANGRYEGGPFEAAATAPLSVLRPSDFTLHVAGVLPERCWLADGVYPLYFVDFSDRLEQDPASGPETQARSDCRIVIPAQDDVYTRLRLKCQTVSTAAVIKQQYQQALQVHHCE